MSKKRRGNNGGWDKVANQGGLEGFEDGVYRVAGLL